MLAPSQFSVSSTRTTIRVSTRSCWSDQIWHLDGLRPGGNRSDFSLDWGFTLPDDSLSCANFAVTA
jgi:hypothetical protein